MSGPADAAINLCMKEGAAPNIALMRLFMAAESEHEARAALDRALITHKEQSAKGAWLLTLKELWGRSPGAYHAVAQVHRTANMRPCDTARAGVCETRLAFNRAASISPEAAVALYSLGNRELLDEITAEVVAAMTSWQLFDSSSVVADLGCGSGRFVRALAPLVRAIIGVDISEVMLRQAFEFPSFSNTLFLRSTGTDLAFLRSDSLDLVMGIDSFPYVVQAGAIGGYFHDSARILRPRGRLLIMNFAYGCEIAVQQAQIADLAATFGLAVLRNGTADLKLWDGRAFLLEKSVRRF